MQMFIPALPTGGAVKGLNLCCGWSPEGVSLAGQRVKAGGWMRP